MLGQQQLHLLALSVAAVEFAVLVPLLVVPASRISPHLCKRGQQLRKHKLLALSLRRRARLATMMVSVVHESAPEALLEAVEASLAVALPPGKAASESLV